MTSYGYDLDMARQKVTLYLDPVVLQRMRVAAARKGTKDSELVEQAVKEFIGQAALERSWAAYSHLVEGMTDDEILDWAVELQHEARRESTE
jgi:metal-responsive CopG/Arc/MetJ family transcriptional regulator